ncbi:MarR family winged helix-turn-helix transcriptional regulator [Neomicrococcus lactis]|uniref:DNA-binding MarR family transcriptional regulator n=1 Tax=Neomicrococcus lactis TaxID=732241 RepID=A0A7W9DC00_9MICC|nr:MarR family transcriptional regulator [Neomicrococcus lactis]MBB5598402.1 DNA-binding MarR family transcriptional regulator [Neomicrococcus lactis]
MKQLGSGTNNDRIAENLYVVGKGAGTSDVLEISDVTPQDQKEISLLMNALANLREAELRLSEASRRFMKLNDQDMRALHYLIVAKRQGEIVTPGMIANHLRISAASTTKLLNRLERDHHIFRLVHPTDRRAFRIEVTEDTQRAAKQTVGKLQARRFHAAARLTSAERATVTRFIQDMTEEISLKNAPWANVSARGEGRTRTG